MASHRIVGVVCRAVIRVRGGALVTTRPLNRILKIQAYATLVGRGSRETRANNWRALGPVGPPWHSGFHHGVSFFCWSLEALKKRDFRASFP